ncbi:MAG: hypothetical protein JJU36_15475 [Phycisphaeraceae bacterium]|nr:hypothetical protein [Phycisphaeraceae bacterium]
MTGSGWFTPLAWGFFLATSWTWCIGMFLPAILLRDFGPWSWYIFAVPNVIGAMAMAWVIRDGALSQRLCHEHRHAMVAFSIVTLAFQVFFISWVLPRFAETGYWIAAAAGALLVIFRLVRHSEKLKLLATFLVWAFSAGLLVYWVWRTEVPLIQSQSWMGSAGVGSLVSLLAVCIFGFALCPYLDPTFHEARQRLSRGSARLAFGLGFGVFFLLMIVFSHAYAHTIVRLLTPEALIGRLGGTQADTSIIFQSGVTLVMIGLLMIHLVTQAGTTLILHFERAMRAGRSQYGVFAVIVLSMVAAYLLARQMGASTALDAPMSPWGMSWLEWVYRMFLSAYGVVFPAYVWIVLHGERKVGRGLVLRWLLAVTGGGVAFWMGLIEMNWPWLIPGVLWMVLLRWMPVERLLGWPGPGDAVHHLAEKKQAGKRESQDAG